MSIYSVNVYIFNICQKKYQCKTLFTIPKGAQGNLLITLTCLTNRGIRNLVILGPRVFLFVDKGKPLDIGLAMQCKSRK